MEPALLLETERLWLRLPALTDAEMIQTLVGDRRIAETTLNIPYPYPDDMALHWVNAVHGALATGRGVSFVLVGKSDHALMGAISFRENTVLSQAEMGYWIGVPYWGQGYMTEAARRVIQYIFEERNMNRVYATHFTSNPASGRVMLKAGMRYEGTQREHVMKWGEPLDLACYGILRRDYEENAQPAEQQKEDGS